MKKVVISFLIIGVITSLGIIGSKYFNKDKKLDSDKTLISYYVETGEGTGVYEKQEGATWPEGYVLNEEKSSCDNGSTLSWDSSTNSVVVTATKEDSCKVYMNKKIPMEIYNLNHNGFDLKITSSNVVLARMAIELGENMYVTDLDIPSSSHHYLFSNTEYKATIDVRYNTGVIQSEKIIIKTKNQSNLSEFCSIGENFSDCLKKNYDKLDKVFYHDENLEYGAKDYSYRYAGDNPNNYICFGSDSDDCPYDNLYRIIGVFNNKLKLIKADYATSSLLGVDGNYVSNPPVHYEEEFSRSGYSSDVLNGAGYYFSLPIEHGQISNLSWKEDKLNTVNLNYNFLESFSKEWQNKIVFSDWFGDGAIDVSLNAKEIFDLERESAVQDNKKVGLMYVSDFAFASEQDYWKESVEFFPFTPEYYFGDKSYNIINIPNGIWLYNSTGETFINNTGMRSVASTISSGIIGGFAATQSYLVRPCFYLTEDILFLGGTGIESNPYRIG